MRLAPKTARTRIAACLALAALCAGMAVAAPAAHGAEERDSEVIGEAERIRVFPLLFLPRETRLTGEEAAAAWARLSESLAHAQEHFRRLLKTDTFAIEPNPSRMYRSPNPHRHFEIAEGASPDSAHLMLRELWADHGETRESTRRVYLIIYVRDSEHACGLGPPPRPCFGGGRSVDSYPSPGGGIVQLEYQDLMETRHRHFLSTLAHEIGHGFGLTHVECLGYDQVRNDSIMSYNPDHHYANDQAGEFHGGLNPEEYFLLSLHRRAFPEFRFDPERHSPAGNLRPGLMRCVTWPMDASLGYPESRGYRLYFDRQLVSGPEAAVYSFHSAEANCAWNIANHPEADVICTYAGKPLDHWKSLIPRR